jgi:hypothetical protein
VNLFKDITIPAPFNRNVNAYCSGHYENDTNAWIGSDIEGCWTDTGDEITEEEFNTELVYLGRVYFLHEFIDEFGIWENDDN